MTGDKAMLAARRTAKRRSMPARRVWIEFEAPEVIELKRIVLDRDTDGAVAFFRGVVAPLVQAAAERCGISLSANEKQRGEGR